MGAALNSRVDKIYFGAKEQKGRSLTNELAAANLLNHTTEVTGGVLEKECSAILSEFFVSLRSRLKAEKEAREQAKKTAEEEKNAAAIGEESETAEKSACDSGEENGN